MTSHTPSIVSVLQGQTLKTPPVWFMRQAGRHLPEYRELRATTPDFLSFCLNPEKAAEATLQPVRRYGMDGAILFSDILVIPMALGQDVRFEAGEGPVLGELPLVAQMADLAGSAGEALKAVGETLKILRSELPREVTLLGFCGGPWTVMTYMLNGRKAHDRSLIRAFVYEKPQLVAQVMDVVIEASAQYLKMQADCGAQVLKIFESWAEGFPDPLFDQLVIEPHQRLVQRVRELGVTLPIIGFPRGAEARCLDYVEQVDVQGMALGTATPLKLGQAIQKKRPIQGALDPVVLRSGGAALDDMVLKMKSAWGQGPYIFNLGHGIFPDTPIAHVERTLHLIRS
ncbi:uroporphyrinogen decarboxylase [Asticcacaulis excentricus]|uniref:Uroporphyrinogen decarboxylase n=1 Tax=Asticcacaulis excentricus (strain ATCC 15261 / DSM 4724 / KCTC 12464 / NCIMB 9791 / VKM B-1370 / CB 48) TaxID=573065 RepID=E8RNT4_ASTEC|nr:uroporphyrinogen decarboxylase [Asticcacaulis excentricus]ADU11847.1 uroporphyrinogen decarboxylase [Asticcacaulis excentricus CB 48]